MQARELLAALRSVQRDGAKMSEGGLQEAEEDICLKAATLAAALAVERHYVRRCARLAPRRLARGLRRVAPKVG